MLALLKNTRQLFFLVKGWVSVLLCLETRRDRAFKLCLTSCRVHINIPTRNEPRVIMCTLVHVLVVITSYQLLDHLWLGSSDLVADIIITEVHHVSSGTLRCAASTVHLLLHLLCEYSAFILFK